MAGSLEESSDMILPIITLAFLSLLGLSCIIAPFLRAAR